jgi:hypothetical protein
LEAVNRGEFTINGLRNRDLQRLLYDQPAASKPEARRRSAAISRQLRLLRAHGLLHKLPHTHRYQVSEKGRLVLNAILTARHATTRQLLNKAA